MDEEIFSDTLRGAPAGDLFVFAYGSLLWRAGFVGENLGAGRVFGYCRRLAVWSDYYRGTPARRGLVFGLDAGGSCWGVVYRVAASQKRRVLRYLFRREMRTDIYRPLFLPVAIGGKTVRALVFVVCRSSGQYAPPLPDKKAAAIILRAAGVGGGNAEYVRNTGRALEAQGIAAPAVRRICRLLGEGVK